MDTCAGIGSLRALRRNELPETPDVPAVHLVDQRVGGQAVFTGGGLYALHEVLLDEPGGRGEDDRQEPEAGAALGGLVALHEARRHQVEFVPLLYLLEDTFRSLLVFELHLDGEALLAGDVVRHASEGAIGDVDDLAGEGPDGGGPEPELLDHARSFLGLDRYEVSDAVLVLEEDEEARDYVA